MSKARRVGRQEQLLLGQVGIIDALYAAATDLEGWRNVASALGASLGGTPAIIHRRGAPLRTAQFLASNMDPAFTQAYVEYFAPLNPWEIGSQGSRRPALFVNDGPVSSEAIEKSEFYADWLRPQGDLRYQINGAAWLSGQETVEVVVMRARRLGPVEEMEAGMLGRVLPHLQRAVDLSQRLALAEAGRLASHGVARPLGAGVLLVDAARRVLSIDPEAERILQSGGLMLRQGKLRAVGMFDERLDQAVAQATGEGRQVSGRTGDLLTVPRGEEQLPLSVAVGPLDDRQRPLGLWGPLAIVVVSAPERTVGPSEESLRALFDLTPAEARLVVGLCAGQTLADYAGHSGTSLNTIKTHLKRVFGKTGEARQADLVRRVAGDVALRVGSRPLG